MSAHHGKEDYDGRYVYWRDQARDLSRRWGAAHVRGRGHPGRCLLGRGDASVRRPASCSGRGVAPSALQLAEQLHQRPGDTACGPFKVPHGTPAYVCSPMHSAMNASFIIAGILTIAGALLLRHFWPRSRGTTVALILWVITGLGKIAVGLVPENTNIDLHLLAAFNVPVGCVAILLLSVPPRQPSRAVSLAGIVLAVVGLAATVLSTAAEFASNSSLDLGLKAGGMERLADYPGALWILMIGLIAALSAGHHAAPRSR
jgi:hypothetical membrane protein